MRSTIINAYCVPEGIDAGMGSTGRKVQDYARAEKKPEIEKALDIN